MRDPKTLAYINLYGILGSLENLCELDDKAKALLSDIKPVTVGFAVKDGPNATLCFSKDGCKLIEGTDKCDIKLPFSSYEKFNGVIDGTVTPIPSKGFTKIGFLTKTFTALTDRLTELMRPSPEALKDPKFFEVSTLLTFYTIASAISQLGNHDPISTLSASYIIDGDIHFGIKNVTAATIRAKDGKLTTIKSAPEKPRAIMEFDSLQLAYDLFNDNVNSLACIGNGTIIMKGMCNMLDNLNRILDRVAVYLA